MACSNEQVFTWQKDVEIIAIPRDIFITELFDFFRNYSEIAVQDLTTPILAVSLADSYVSRNKGEYSIELMHAVFSLASILSDNHYPLSLAVENCDNYTVKNITHNILETINYAIPCKNFLSDWNRFLPLTDKVLAESFISICEKICKKNLQDKNPATLLLGIFILHKHKYI